MGEAKLRLAGLQNAVQEQDSRRGISPPVVRERVNLSLSPEVDSALESISSLTGIAKSQLATMAVMNSLPWLRGLAAAVKS